MTIVMRNRLLLAAAGGLLLSGCASIEHPEDCDIRCGFGKNDQFERENDVMRDELEEIRASNDELTQRRLAAQAEEAALLKREKELKIALAKQADETAKLQEALKQAVAQNRVDQSTYDRLQDELASINSDIENYRSKERFTPKQIAEADEFIKTRVVNLRSEMASLNIVGADMTDNL